MRDFIVKEPVLDLCAGMVVENGSPFTNFDSNTMQMMMTWGKIGAGDKSKGRINGAKVRARIQEDAEQLRKDLKTELHSKVLHLCADMASKDGRCFIGELFCIFFKDDVLIWVINVGLNAQYYSDAEGMIKLVNLATREVFESHSGDNIRKWIKDSYESYGIEGIQLLGLAIDILFLRVNHKFSIISDICKDRRSREENENEIYFCNALGFCTSTFFLANIEIEL